MSDRLCAKRHLNRDEVSFCTTCGAPLTDDRQDVGVSGAPQDNEPPSDAAPAMRPWRARLLVGAIAVAVALLAFAVISFGPFADDGQDDAAPTATAAESLSTTTVQGDPVETTTTSTAPDLPPVDPMNFTLPARACEWSDPSVGLAPSPEIDIVDGEGSAGDPTYDPAGVFAFVIDSVLVDTDGEMGPVTVVAVHCGGWGGGNGWVHSLVTLRSTAEGGVETVGDVIRGYEKTVRDIQSLSTDGSILIVSGDEWAQGGYTDNGYVSGDPACCASLTYTQYWQLEGDTWQEVDPPANGDAPDLPVPDGISDDRFGTALVRLGGSLQTLSAELGPPTSTDLDNGYNSIWNLPGGTKIFVTTYDDDGTGVGSIYVYVPPQGTPVSLADGLEVGRSTWSDVTDTWGPPTTSGGYEDCDGPFGVVAAFSDEESVQPDTTMAPNSTVRTFEAFFPDAGPGETGCPS